MKAPGESPIVFLSYRSSIDHYAAALLDKELSTVLGQDTVFLASRRLKEADLNYPEKLLGAVRASKVLLALIGRGWNTVTDDTGVRLLYRPNDWVRLEIATALEHGISVIPIVLRGAGTEVPVDLPLSLRNMSGLRPLRFYNRNTVEEIDAIVQEITARRIK